MTNKSFVEHAIGLQDSDEMLSTLMRATPDVVCIKDDRGRWLMASDAAQRIFRLESDVFLGKDDTELGELFPFFREAFAYCAYTDETTWQCGGRCVHEEVVPQPGGEPVILETIKTPLYRPDGAREAMLLVGRDITERKRVEHEVVRRTVELEKAKELHRLKNDFVNAVSHELRTPLTSILGFAEFLEDGFDGPLTPGQMASVHQIQSNTARLTSLVDDLLDFARIEAGAFRLAIQEADLVAVVGEVNDSLFPLANEKGVVIECRVPDVSLRLPFDRNRIAQVLINLVGNAVKFTEPGGRITVEALRTDDAVRVEVRDTGVGVSAAQLAHVFDKFYQADSSLTREAGGTGLGLSIAKSLIEAHSGQMGATSELGQGSTFWFTLPQTPPA